MKQTIVIIFLLHLSIGLSAQDINAKLAEVYGDKLQEFTSSNPEMIVFFDDLLKNRIKIYDWSAETDRSKFPKLSEVALLNKYNPALQRDNVFNPDTFNPLKYNMEFTSVTTRKIYVVDGTNYVILIEPQNISH